MGKRYYCDYCERSFADGAENRKKHLASVHHQKLRKAHYDMFKDAAVILEENRQKKPCRKFHQTGHCEFGSGCKYSHLTPLDVQNLEEQVRQEKLGITLPKPRVEPDIDSWLQAKVSKMKEPPSATPADVQHPILPSVLSSIPNLPPSLIPSKPSEISNVNKETTAQWG
ncbi:zinc finger matrin-type protein 5-like isoform X2 [Stegodyphus dumicola]|uniref:zinc finger matrin-type protein 5-like isoform X2 n=1 Tax=Stegodyphus dumicola TaxID=202533 RepID=UPI0015AE9833|nr:zinc finger matrin-type protein 5-like isoform X2 [Stegodyphus dumicola]XP_035225913.1 zinc finger matrin-type protein 5-like isoform X2 [Stegodyphus dumicola]